jgi:hypothetical protein
MREIRSAFVPDEITPIHVAAKPEGHKQGSVWSRRGHTELSSP